MQEVILKRAADLVEALYGMPHNNQVRGGGPRGVRAEVFTLWGTKQWCGGAGEGWEVQLEADLFQNRNLRNIKNHKNTLYEANK